MATQLSIVNRILKRLREDQVTTITENTYSLLIADFVSDAYEEFVQSTDWRSLHHTILVDLIPGVTEYNLSSYVMNGGNVTNTDPRVASPDSVLLYSEEAGAPLVFMYDDDTDEYGWNPIVVTREQILFIKSQDRTETNTYPNYVAFYPAEGTGDALTMEVYPSPETVRQIKASFYTEPAPLTSDGTNENDPLLVPDRPVFQLGLLYAYQERGEEIGEPGGIAANRAQNAVDGAIETEMISRNRGNTYDWRRD